MSTFISRVEVAEEIFGRIGESVITVIGGPLTGHSETRLSVRSTLSDWVLNIPDTHLNVNKCDLEIY